MREYRLVITGPTGVGKSTILNLLTDMTKSISNKVQIFPEFISTEFGLRMFNEYSQGNITALTFQSYILDYYATFKQEKPIVIFERCIDDSLLVFCKNCVRTHTMTTQEYDTLNSKLSHIKATHDLPTYTDSNTRVIRMTNDDPEATATEIIDLMQEDREHKITTRIVILKTSLIENEKRIRSRGRNGEEHLTTDYIKHINQYYDEI